MPDGLHRRGPGEVVNLANIITFARLCAVPVAVWFVLHRQLGLAAIVFAGAAVSDALDGWLARRRGGTALGAMLDPLADKALLVSMFVTLAAVGVLPDWLAILVVFRDILIVGGILLLWQAGHPVRIKPLRISKVNTALQLALIAMVLLLEAFGLEVWPLRLALIGVVTASTLLSGAAYVRAAAR